MTILIIQVEALKRRHRRLLKGPPIEFLRSTKKLSSAEFREEQHEVLRLMPHLISKTHCKPPIQSSAKAIYSFPSGLLRVGEK